jgi:hypothetical protein
MFRGGKAFKPGICVGWFVALVSIIQQVASNGESA